jgi:tyrosine-protein kinase Etk/Wzc
MFQQDRLRRDVTMRQQLYTSLAESYEHAKIDEVRDTPVITIVERPDLPVRPDPRGLIKWGLVSLLAGFLLGAGLAWLADGVQRARVEDPAEYDEFAQLRRRSTEDLLLPWRRLRRVWRRAPSE